MVQVFFILGNDRELLFFIFDTFALFSKFVDCKKISFNQNLLLTVLISLTLYARQQFIFLAVFHILLLLLNKNRKDLIYTIIIYSLLSIPGFYVLFIWGAFEDLSQTTTQSTNLDFKNIFLNIPKKSHLYFFSILYH